MAPGALLGGDPRPTTNSSGDGGRPPTRERAVGATPARPRSPTVP
ncbi:MAG: hypothetical protein AVDCRST_MAG48-3681 [uncultured Friedmanniella sp.]|uniref:Uncharacterized protein n=1 Tax=uncultured Friedmanniella sp. TaxID=335381 RepID=A0A6J4LUK7_9ACTN|nr:MAG: hypothetical protein AVDCRST_MAG48-3681 [uncultured Friedmanniella sp.]